MLKRMILAGLLAATALPALASDASYDKAATTQSATTSAHDGAKDVCACKGHSQKS